MINYIDGLDRERGGCPAISHLPAVIWGIPVRAVRRSRIARAGSTVVPVVVVRIRVYSIIGGRVIARGAGYITEP